ncbi:alcohol dehydrogenase 2-like [Acanthaster planci]|uniref:Alcohol dehydrogenase 2-like n=1 Tax=Acanthaster planci TaxID=133434 RepID=A0A8B7ZHL6_ACAPL|nr:alcohol dehydrogenase 2-like [Acanthaster planci]XP_022105082.1 alcohol dehydrogenase 2-like [Acanthaster planci]
MKCIRVTAPGKPLVFLDDYPIPKAPDGGAVVKISYSGVCHTDVHFWEGGYTLGGGKELKFQDRPGFLYPCVPGHEISGILFSLDERATKDDSQSGLKLGDRVVVYPWIFCNACRPCRLGYNIFCDGSPPVYIGMTRDGGFAQYVAVPEVRYVVPVCASIPLTVASLLPCSGLTAYHAVENAVEFVKNVTEIKGCCSVMVIGAGGLGQWGICFARSLYPSETQIICADVKQKPLDLVTSNVGTVEPLLIDQHKSSDSIIQQVKTASRTGSGVDLILDFVGSTQTFEVAKKSLRMRGRYHVIGLLGGEAHMSLPEVVLNGRSIIGIKVGSLVQLRRLVDLMAKTPSLFANLQYTVHPLEDGIQAMEKVAKGQIIGRAILKCCGDDE